MQDYSLNQIKRMEQEATRRAREYNSRAKPPTNVQNKSYENQPQITQNNTNKPHQKEREPCGDMGLEREPQQKKRGSFSFLNALDIKKLIGENSEQAMLLLLILILSNDNTCDEYLIYALIYIML